MGTDYNVHSDRIAYSNRRQRGLFDGLFENQIIVNVWNKMHEMCGDETRNNYDVFEVIEKAINKTNDIMGK